MERPVAEPRSCVMQRTDAQRIARRHGLGLRRSNRPQCRLLPSRASLHFLLLACCMQEEKALTSLTQMIRPLRSQITTPFAEACSAASKTCRRRRLTPGLPGR
jgi:hypothetical protein